MHSKSTKGVHKKLQKGTPGGTANMIAFTSMFFAVVLRPASIPIPAILPLRYISWYKLQTQQKVK